MAPKLHVALNGVCPSSLFFIDSNLSYFFAGFCGSTEEFCGQGTNTLFSYKPPNDGSGPQMNPVGLAASQGAGAAAPQEAGQQMQQQQQPPQAPQMPSFPTEKPVSM